MTLLLSSRGTVHTALLGEGADRACGSTSCGLAGGGACVGRSRGQGRQIQAVSRFKSALVLVRWEDQGLSLAPWAEPVRASLRSECGVKFGAGTIWDSHSLCWSWGSLQCSHANSSSPGCFCIFDKAACLASSEPCRDRGLGLNGKWQMDYAYLG